MDSHTKSYKSPDPVVSLYICIINRANTNCKLGLPVDKVIHSSYNLVPRAFWVFFKMAGHSTEGESLFSLEFKMAAGSSNFVPSLSRSITGWKKIEYKTNNNLFDVALAIYAKFSRGIYNHVP